MPREELTELEKVLIQLLAALEMSSNDTVAIVCAMEKDEGRLLEMLRWLVDNKDVLPELPLVEKRSRLVKKMVAISETAPPA